MMSTFSTGENEIPFKEGEIQFEVSSAGQECKTWYRAYGDLTSSRPLVILHGGPGIPHNYLLPVIDLARSSNPIPVVFYDQLGCGNSTHLPAKKGDSAFWTPALFLAELDNLIRFLGIENDYDILGQSWGGMLAAEHAVQRPKGLKHIVLANSPADMVSWVGAADRLRQDLPEDVQAVLKRCEREGKEGTPEYKEAMMVFYDRHVCRVKPMPKDLARSFELLEQDDTVYLTMNGPSEFRVSGTLKNWSIISRLQHINVPTLLINGRYDEAQDEVVMPYFREIQKVKWVRFAESSHTPQLEEREEFMRVVEDFLGRGR